MIYSRKKFIIFFFFTKCLNETSFSINICGKPPLLTDASYKEAIEFCSKAFVYINCLDESLSMVCDEFKGNNTSSTIKQFQNLRKIVNKTYESNSCDSKKIFFLILIQSFNLMKYFKRNKFYYELAKCNSS